MNKSNSDNRSIYVSVPRFDATEEDIQQEVESLTQSDELHITCNPGWHSSRNLGILVDSAVDAGKPITLINSRGESILRYYPLQELED